MKKIVLTGGPYAGKSTLIARFRDEGFAVAEEAAIRVIRELTLELGLEAQRRWRRENVAEFQLRIARLQLESELEAEHSGADLVIFDRGILDGVAYCRHRGVEPPPALWEAAKDCRYDAVFLLDTLASFEPREESGRADDRLESARVRERIREVYVEHGYAPVFVPRLPVEKRGERIRRAILSGPA